MSYVLYLTNDLMFSSRVSPLVKQCGGELKTVSTAGALLEATKNDSPAVILLDLNSPALSSDTLSETLAGLRQAASPPPYIVAYASHVHESKLEAAREAKPDLTLTRGQFNQSIGEVLKQRLPHE